MYHKSNRLEAELTSYLGVGNFLTGASFSLVMPFMSLYVEELGARGSDIEFYAGLVVSVTALGSTIMSPIWGSGRSLWQ